MSAPVSARRLIAVAPDLKKYGGCKTCRSASFDRIPPADRPAVALDLYRLILDSTDEREDLVNGFHLLGAVLAGDSYDVWCPKHDPCMDLAAVLNDYREGRRTP